MLGAPCVVWSSGVDHPTRDIEEEEDVFLQL
jgi:hypothetical protein